VFESGGLFVSLAFLLFILFLQGDTSRCSLGAVDIKTKVVPQYKEHMLYPVSHPIEPRDFVMISFMTCDCPLVWLGLAFESSTLARFSEKPQGSMGWEPG